MLRPLLRGKKSATKSHQSQPLYQSTYILTIYMDKKFVVNRTLVALRLRFFYKYVPFIKNGVFHAYLTSSFLNATSPEKNTNKAARVKDFFNQVKIDLCQIFSTKKLSLIKSTEMSSPETDTNSQSQDGIRKIFQNSEM